MNWKRQRWVKLYVKEEGSFATLSATTRAYAAAMLKLVDGNGFIATGRSADISTSVAFQMGAEQGDRRLIRKAVTELLADGYLVAVEGGVRVRNFDEAQGTKKADAQTSSSRACNEPVTSSERASHELETKKEVSERNLSLYSCVDKSREEEKREEKSAPSAAKPASLPAPPASPTVLEIRCNGTQAIWLLTAAQVADWAAVFPGLDVLAECRKADAWLKANPGKRKTATGMPRFLLTWLGRANDSIRAPQQLFPQQRPMVANPYRKI